MESNFYTAISLILFIKEDGVAPLQGLKLARFKKKNSVLHSFHSTCAHFSLDLIHLVRLPVARCRLKTVFVLFSND